MVESPRFTPWLHRSNVRLPVPSTDLIRALLKLTAQASNLHTVKTWRRTRICHQINGIHPQNGHIVHPECSVECTGCLSLMDCVDSSTNSLTSSGFRFFKVGWFWMLEPCCSTPHVHSLGPYYRSFSYEELLSNGSVQCTCQRHTLQARQRCSRARTSRRGRADTWPRASRGARPH